MKKSIITLVLALFAMAGQAQEISKAEPTAADYIKLLNKQGYQVFALDMSKFEKKKYLMSPVIQVWSKGKMEEDLMSSRLVADIHYIEDLIERENTFSMEEFVASVDNFLSFRRYDILPDKGKISMQQAKDKAGVEYDAFNKAQKITSDFDREVKKLLEKNEKS